MVDRTNLMGNAVRLEDCGRTHHRPHESPFASVPWLDVVPVRRNRNRAYHRQFRGLRQHRRNC